MFEIQRLRNRRVGIIFQGVLDIGRITQLLQIVT
jgi:hypothetical protein